MTHADTMGQLLRWCLTPGSALKELGAVTCWAAQPCRKAKLRMHLRWGRHIPSQSESEGIGARDQTNRLSACTKRILDVPIVESHSWPRHARTNLQGRSDPVLLSCCGCTRAVRGIPIRAAPSRLPCVEHALQPGLA